MSTRIVWRPDRAEQPVLKTLKEELEPPPRRWPELLVLLFTLLLGLAAGAWIAGNNQEDLDAATLRLEAVSDQLDVAQQEIGRLQGDELALAKVRLDRDVIAEELDEVVRASAQLFDELPSAAMAGPPVDPAAWAVLKQSFATANAGDVPGYLRTFASDGTLTLLMAGLHQEFHGAEIGSLLSQRPHLRFVGEPMQRGEYLWTRYRESASAGVVIARIAEDEITHQWVVGRNW